MIEKFIINKKRMPMNLQPKSLVDYLLEKNLVAQQSVVDGDIVIIDISRRNQNFKVLRKQGNSYLVKQAAGQNPQAVKTLQREAALYAFSDNDPDFAPLKKCLVRYFGFDIEHSILIIECLHDGESLATLHQRTHKFLKSLGTEMAKMLGKLHYDFSHIFVDNPKLSIFQCNIPWILYIHEPGPEILQSVSIANLELIKIIQQYPDYCNALNRLRSEWQPSTFIHGDLKWDNWISKSYNGHQYKLKLVDWEMADFGDPAWDVGAIFNDYLSFWILTMPVTGRELPEKFTELTEFPLSSMQPAMQAFWQAYKQAAKLNSHESICFLERTTKFCAARMIQTAYEQMQMSSHLTGNIISMLQVSSNILKRPREAIVHLLGIPLGE